MLFKYYDQFDINIFYINIILDIVNEIVLIIVLLYIFNRLFFKREIEKIKEEKGIIYNLITWALFFGIIGIGNVLKIIVSFWSISGSEYEGSILILEKIQIILVFLAFLTKILYIEYIINTQKFYRGYFFTIIFAIVTIIIIFIDLENIKEIGVLQSIFIILLFIGYSILPFLYLILSIKLVGKARLNAFKVSAGFTLLGISSLIQPDNLLGYLGISEILDTLIELTYITGPIGVILSTLILFGTFRKKEIA